MRALVRVVPTAEYESWLKRQPEVTPSPGSPNGSSKATSEPGIRGWRNDHDDPIHHYAGGTWFFTLKPRLGVSFDE